jgi:hypothetical protein
MRSNQNPSGSATRSVGDRNVGARGVVAGAAVENRAVAKLNMPQMPVEWLDSGSWRLPSGKALAEFALQAGFLAPLLFRADRLGKSSLNGSSEMQGTKEMTPGSSEINAHVAPIPGKQSGDGDGR